MCVCARARARYRFHNLPLALSAQLNLSTNRRLAAHCAFFRDVTNASLVALIADFKAEVYIPAQTIATQGAALVAVYFVNRGIVRVTLHEVIHSTLTNNDNFGLDDFFAGSSHRLKQMPTPVNARDERPFGSRGGSPRVLMTSHRASAHVTSSQAPSRAPSCD